MKDGTPVWPLIRQAVYFQVLKKNVQYSNKLRTRRKRLLIKNFFYGLSKLFSLKKYEYLYFNNTDKRVYYNEAYFDIYYDAWADLLGQDKSLFIEWAIEKHLPNEQLHSHNVMSDLPFKFLTKLISISIPIHVEGRHILQEIFKEYKISINVNKVLKDKLAEYRLFRKLFKRIKPKAVFVLSSFTKVSIVYAAKMLNIPVLEPQHGFIGNTHPFYNAQKKFPEFYPDTLLSFGTFEKEARNHAFIFDEKSIKEVGSFQLDLVKVRQAPKVLEDFKKQYEIIFCVTLQAIRDEEILQWVIAQAQINTNWLFIIRPKQPNLDIQLYTKEDNIIVLPEISTYDVLKASNFNITIFSTTVIEGIYLGAKPILYNIDNLPKKYFDLDAADIALIENGEPINQGHLQRKGKFPIPYFVENYFVNVAKAAKCI
ncbi:hypothetical protein G5B37_10210 [Rasiella rasia]|uniref:Glycosyltransferase n=1 Tax=Rasiella rasia TaxID=2744027 RepID=A0A6G6GN21_9FLAO|nr:hypothetical protein [Rasiella rasia]QIE59924.1 hypothetical protein G5B37_10210 [Rasiella rasia]